MSLRTVDDFLTRLTAMAVRRPFRDDVYRTGRTT
jgi:hypothetical protein